MSDIGPIIVRLEVDHMRQAIVHAFHDREIELEELLDEKLEYAVRNFDFEGEIKHQAERLFPGMVEDAMKQAIAKVLESQEVMSVIEILARQVIYKFFNNLGR